MNYPEALAWLYGTQQHGIKPGLETMRLLSRDAVPGVMEHEDIGNDVPTAAPPIFIHVAGTNGKGSVCAFLDAIGRAAGLRTGLYTSPHLVSYRERIQLNGRMISEEAVAGGLSTLANRIARWETCPTFFEITTALALDFFQRESADLIILETGLGGRLDATNLITPAVSVITAIDLDHTAWLGSTLEAIASEKAGIIKPGIPVVAAPQHEAAARVLIETARQKNAPLEFVTTPIEEIPVGLAGSHQKLNAALAVKALERAGVQIPDAALREGLTEVTWPGRFQRLKNDRLILDGAHNESAAKRLVQTWTEVFGTEKAAIILGILKDKDMAAICHALQPIASAWILVTVHSPRTAHPEELLNILQPLQPDADFRVASDFAQALDLAESRPERTLLTGSLFLVGEALAHIAGGQHQTSAQ